MPDTKHIKADQDRQNPRMFATYLGVPYRAMLADTGKANSKQSTRQAKQNTCEADTQANQKTTEAEHKGI